MRSKIFISHASTKDDDFTRWLSLKLISLGYQVWCDLLALEKGSDFWKTIENEIRENTSKFLVVLSETSNTKQGVLNEIAIASKVRKQLQDDFFIIPLLIDDKISSENINIELVRLNALNFRTSWAQGLRDLLESLEKSKVHRDSPDPTRSNLLYQQIFLHDKGPIQKEEAYDSNWFPILEFPRELKFHKFGSAILRDFDTRNLDFPAVKYKEYLCTFAWEYDFMNVFPNTEEYDGKNTIKVSTEAIINGEYDSEFIRVSECKKLIVQITNRAFESAMKSKGLREYQMSNKVGYWFAKDQLVKDKIGRILMVGKQKDRNWHFGISAAGKLYPQEVLVVTSHIYFTEDGTKLISSKSTQHLARRKQGKNWWNDDWRSKLLAFISHLSNDANAIHLKVGSEEIIRISNKSIKFVSSFSYVVPEYGILLDEADIEKMNENDENE